MKKVCIVRTTFHDRSPFLQLSLEYQNCAEESGSLKTYIFVDPHPKYGYVKEYDNIITNNYYRINWPRNSGIYSWYDSVKYIYDNTDYEYIISIEDDIIISKDYFRLCNDVIESSILEIENNILFFHIGAWEQPRGDKNLIVRSGASLRSAVINRNKFYKYVVPFYIRENTQISGLDLDIRTILDTNKMTAIAPQMNRHAHIGVYGWSSTGEHANSMGNTNLINKYREHKDLYQYLSKICFDKNKLLELNQYRNSDYFWNFDPNIEFEKLIFDI